MFMNQSPVTYTYIQHNSDPPRGSVTKALNKIIIIIFSGA